jgi:hypothetical protein
MNAQINDILGQIGQHIEEQWGPEDQPETTAAADAAPGDLGATNPSDVQDAFDLYIDGIVERLMANYEMTSDDAVDFIFGVADEFAADGRLPPIPEDDEGTALWVGKAKTLAFGGEVLKAARAQAD